MANRLRPYDPLSYIPSPDAIRAKLAETETLAQRLRILLDTAERIHAAPTLAGAAASGQEARHAS